MSEPDNTFHPQIFTREDVKTAIKGNPHADNIMRYIDVLLNSGKEYQAALELACEDLHEHRLYLDDTVKVLSEIFIKQAREATNENIPTPG